MAAIPPALACVDFRPGAPSRWLIARDAAGPILLTPCRRPFFSLGVNTLDGGASSGSASPRAYRWRRFAPTRAAWAAQTRRRLVRWGFNTAGAWSLPPAEIGLPSTPELELGRWLQVVWTDPFDPALVPRLDRAAAAAVAPYRGNPLRIGYFSDNEIGWWNGPLFTAYMGFAADNHTKRRLIALLRAHYRDSWSAFTQDFVPAAGTASFTDLLSNRTPPHLRPGGRGIDVIRAWTGIIAGQYYKLMRDALRRADPDALYLGDRLPIYYDPDAVRAMAPYVDAISVNYNVDAADGWIAPYFFRGLKELSGGKPVLITEWFYAAIANRSGNLDRTGEPHDAAHARISNNRNRTGHLMTVATQAERALGARRAARLLAAQPDVIGVHWFQYADEPPGGRADGEDYDFGLVDTDNRPYRRLVQALETSNRGVLSRIARPASAAISRLRGNNDAVPFANIDPAEESLADWPKAASLIAMKPAAGEVDFGDIYLTWDRYGLNLATIAMDYYDPDLLGIVAPFPRSEAFRIALGVNAGGGPQRIELRVAPTSVVRTAADEEKLTFGVEVCRYAPTESCSAIPGAVAHYFGTALDQPRVILKAFIPWSALGVAGAPASRAIRLALGVTAFYRSRWMSSDGVAPDIAMAHPKAWHRFALGGPAAPDFSGPRLARADHAD
ncbi:MAG TPA: hypothetical protein VME41_10965 [Stellaceae bacterium]|nr:hypothetical protein [Stellaceae bacterium]